MEKDFAKRNRALGIFGLRRKLACGMVRDLFNATTARLPRELAAVLLYDENRLVTLANYILAMAQLSTVKLI